MKPVLIGLTIVLLLLPAAVGCRQALGADPITCSCQPGGEGAVYSPPLWSAAPFAALLLAIAVLPLAPRCRKFWHRNRNKLLVAMAISVPVLLFYCFAHPAQTLREGDLIRHVSAGLPAVGEMLSRAMLEEYVPFIVLLLSLYTISGGVSLRGDLPAHPLTNTAFLALGSVLASLIGTTGAAMVLIRPLLQTNQERKHIRHTVVFFIFLVCNIGGCLLPIGDPPLFLGYLMGVPFLWTLNLAAEWAVATAALLAIYYVWDSLAYRRETVRDVRRDESVVKPLRLRGRINLLYLLGVVLAAGLLVPGKPFVLLPWFIVPEYLREAAMLALAALSLLTTPRGVRKDNHFNFEAIAEVAVLFAGIFITMQPPIEMLRAGGSRLGLSEPWQFFWATGVLSSFLDNAPTYVVFFEAAGSLTRHAGEGIMALGGGQYIRLDLLAAVSLGAVFMGANTYIGNGPNFMVKAIAEQRGVKMPGFFGYMLYSACVLLPLFVLLSLLFSAIGWAR